MKINEEALRVLANLAQHYDVWLNASRLLADGRLQWKKIAGKEYLYRIVDSAGNGRSLGPRSSDTEALFADFETVKETRDTAQETLRLDAALYKALRLPRLPSYAGSVLRELDINGELGTSVLVVGTNAICVYAIEAGETLPSGMDTTDDFDLTWTAPAFGRTNTRPNMLLSILKKIDRTYTINTERSFQVRNAKGYEVELLLPQSLAQHWSKSEQLKPIPMREQDWLLEGKPLAHVVCDFADLPARVIAPDPRWFGLHKIWLSAKPERNPLKKDKDLSQGLTVLDLAADRMPRFPIDDAFTSKIPGDLKTAFDRWQSHREKTRAGR